MNRVRTRLGAAVAAMALGASLLAATGGSAQALSNPPKPGLAFDHFISSHPWPTGTLTGVNANDIEGLVSVPSDNSIWVADDNRDRIFEIDATTGGLKSQVLASAFQTTATQVGSNQLCSDPAQVDPTLQLTDPVTHLPVADTSAYECLSRTDDFESIVYDPGSDTLYVTSGGCCGAGLPTGYPKHPTVWELKRSAGHFAPTRWQALPETEDPTAAGWRPGTGMYYGKNNFMRTYDFATNALGSKITAPSYLVGIDFVDATTVFLTTATPNTATGRTTATSDSTTAKYTFDGSSFTAVPGWNFPFKNTGVIDARDLALVGDTFYISDGYDYRTGSEFNGTNIPGDHLIYVFKLVDTSPPPGTWHYEVLNGSSHFANGNAMLKYGTQLHDFYADAVHGSLVHSWWDGTRWNVETLDGAGRNTTHVVGTVVEAMQYGSQVQLFYLDATAHTLRHAWWDGTRWNFETLDGAGGANGRTTDAVATGTLSIAQYGTQVQIMYPDNVTHKLRHAWWDGTRWNFETFDAAMSLPGASYVSTTQFGSTYRVAFKTSTGTLRHDYFDGTWHLQTLDGTGGVSGHTNDQVGDGVVMKPVGSQLDVVYQDATTSSVRHAALSGSSWSFETIDGTGGSSTGQTNDHVGAYLAATPYGGQLHVVYQDTTTGALRHAWYSSGWHAEIIDGAGSTKPGSTASANTGVFGSMIDYGGQLQLTYFDHANGDRLEHAWFS